MNMNNQMEEAESSILHTYNRFPVVFERGEGVHLFDSEGSKYLDFAAGIAVNSLGYHYPGYDEALKEQINKLTHISNLYYNEPIIEAGAKLVNASRMDKAFFTNSGTEAIEGALKAAKNNGTIISYDPNYRASLWDSQEEACKWMRSILEYADIVKVSEEEIELLTGYTDVRKAAESITEYGAKIVLITLGEKGSFVYLQDQQEAYVSGYSSKVVDTTGAGDSFMGGFLYKICESGKHIEEYSLQEMIECVRFGNAVASLCVEREGAIPAMPVMEEVIKRINS